MLVGGCNIHHELTADSHTTASPEVGMSLSPIPSAFHAMNQIMASAANFTLDVALAPFKFVLAISRAAFDAIDSVRLGLPRHIGMLVSEVGQGAVAGPTDMGAHTVSQAASNHGLNHSELSAASSTTVNGRGGQSPGLGASLGLNNPRNVSSILNYITSKWAIACLAVVR